jgi:hypothetical protein
MIDLFNMLLSQISEIRGQLKAQQKLGDTGDDPDSRMDTDRGLDMRREKKNPGGGSGQGGSKGGKGGGGGGGGGQRGGSGGKSSFWQK